MTKKINITGKRYNRLLAIKYVGYSPTSHQSIWEFICDCGKKINLTVGNVKNNHTKSCGCLNKEMSSKRLEIHGMRLSQEYNTWSQMKKRCNNKNDKSYKNYGGRGIIICDRWLESFENFFEDMGLKPSPKHSIDRIDNNGNYEPNNCRWATQYEQNNNYSRNIFIEINEERKTIKEWCNIYNLPYHKIYQRIVKLKWSAKKAFNLL